MKLKHCDLNYSNCRLILLLQAHLAIKMAYKSSLGNSSSALFKNTAIGIQRDVLSVIQKNLTNVMSVHVTHFSSHNGGAETKVSMNVIMRSVANTTSSSQSHLLTSTMTSAIKSGSFKNVDTNYTLPSLSGKCFKYFKLSVIKYLNFFFYFG